MLYYSTKGAKMTTLTTCGEFMFDLFAGTIRPRLGRGKLNIDGKNDALFLKRILNEFYLVAPTKESFVELFNKEINEATSPIRKWLEKRMESLKNNFEFVIWSAWKVITAPK